MILTPNQWKVLRDSWALGSFLESDPRLQDAARNFKEAAAELIEVAERIAEREEITAPF